MSIPWKNSNLKLAGPLTLGNTLSTRGFLVEKKLFIKAEILPKKEAQSGTGQYGDVDGGLRFGEPVYCALPRVICPEDVKLVGHEKLDEVHVTQYFSSVLDGLQIIQFGEDLVAFCYAVSRSAFELSLAFNNWYRSRSFTLVFVQGDDTAVFYSDSMTRRGFVHMESDFKKFDLHQDSGPLVHATKIWMHHFGFETETWQDFVTYVSMPYKIRCQGMSVTGSPGRPMMATGAAVTILLNSIHAMISILEHIVSKRTFDDVCRDLGLDVTIALHENPLDITFLRGAFYEARENFEFSWGPLPGIAKYGKISSDINKVFPKGKSPESWNERYMLLAYGVYKNMENLPPDFPVLGSYVRKMRSLSGKYLLYDNRKDLPVINESGMVTRFVPLDDFLRTWIESYDYKVRADFLPVSRESVLSFMSRRYGLSAEDVRDAESLIDSVTALPVIIHHVVFSTMWQVDYE